MVSRGPTPAPNSCVVIATWNADTGAESAAGAGFGEGAGEGAGAGARFASDGGRVPPPHPSRNTGTSASRRISFVTRDPLARSCVAIAYRISRFRILPVGPLGRLSRNSTMRGYLYAASFSLQYAITSSAVALEPGFIAITAFTSSPWLGCGTPITAASRTPGNA